MISKEEVSRICKSSVSRSKASERRVAKLLSDWSGIRWRRRRIEGRDTSTIALSSTSDVVPVTRNSRFTVEVKIERGFSFDALLTSPATALFTSWFHQVTYDAKLLNEAAIFSEQIFPLLFFKPAPANDWIAFPRSVVGYIIEPTDTSKICCRPLWFNHLVFDGYARTGPITCNVSRTKNKRLVSLDLEPVVICRWKDFAAAVDPKPIFFDGAYRVPVRQTTQSDPSCPG